MASVDVSVVVIPAGATAVDIAIDISQSRRRVVGSPATARVEAPATTMAGPHDDDWLSHIERINGYHPNPAYITGIVGKLVAPPVFCDRDSPQLLIEGPADDGREDG